MNRNEKKQEQCARLQEVLEALYLLFIQLLTINY